MNVCAVDGCPKRASCRGWCVAHYSRWYRNGDTGAVETFAGAPSGSAHPRCGGPAAHWAYNHKDPNQLISPDGRPYSADPSFYEPMCASCHTKADRSRTGTPATGCSVDGCERAHAARGLCKHHHRLARRAA